MPYDGRRRGRHVPVVPGDGRGGALHARAGPAAATRCSRARWSPTAGARPRSGTRSTCACPARAAAPTARWRRRRAAYKAEFLHHHYEGRRRPAAHRTIGRLPAWLRLVDRTGTAPLLNSLASVRPFAALAKRLGDRTRAGDPAPGTTETFSRWWGRRFKDRVRRMMREGAYSQVELDEPRGRWRSWPDTFTEHLSPSVGQAAVRVLEAAGVDVMLPPTVVMRKRTPRAGESVSLSHHPWSVGAPGPRLLRTDVRLHRPTRPRPRGDAPHARPDGRVPGPGRHAIRGHPPSSSWNRAAPPPCARTSPSSCTTTRARRASPRRC